MKHIIGLLSIQTDFIILLSELFMILDGCCFDYVFIGVDVEKSFVFKDTLMLLPLQHLYLCVSSVPSHDNNFDGVMLIRYWFLVQYVLISLCYHREDGSFNRRVNLEIFGTRICDRGGKLQLQCFRMKDKNKSKIMYLKQLKQGVCNRSLLKKNQVVKGHC